MGVARLYPTGEVGYRFPARCDCPPHPARSPHPESHPKVPFYRSFVSATALTITGSTPIQGWGESVNPHRVRPIPSRVRGFPVPTRVTCERQSWLSVQ